MQHSQLLNFNEFNLTTSVVYINDDNNDCVCVSMCANKCLRITFLRRMMIRWNEEKRENNINWIKIIAIVLYWLKFDTISLTFRWITSSERINFYRDWITSEFCDINWLFFASTSEIFISSLIRGLRFLPSLFSPQVFFNESRI